MKDSKERIIPLMISMIFYFWTYWVFKNLDSVFILRVMLLGNFWGIILLFLINIFLKISMHAMAIGGMLGIIIVLMLLSPVNMNIPSFPTRISLSALKKACAGGMCTSSSQWHHPFIPT